MKILYATLFVVSVGCASEPTPGSEPAVDQADGKTDSGWEQPFELPTSLSMTVLFEGADGLTHFRTDQLPLTQGPSPTGEITAGTQSFTATTAKMIVHAPHFGCSIEEPHAVTSNRFLTILHGKFLITAGDGEQRLLRKGDIAQLLDKAPSEGHLGCAVGSEPLLLLFTNLP